MYQNYLYGLPGFGLLYQKWSKDQSEVKKVFPNCHVEFKNCVMKSWNGFEWEYTPLDYTISADDEQDSNPHLEIFSSMTSLQKS